jgi:hypothetical protein
LAISVSRTALETGISLPSKGPPGTACIIRKTMIDTTRNVKAIETSRRTM